MKFKVQSTDLVSMLKIVIKGFDARDDSSFIYFKVEDNKLIAVSDSSSAYFRGSVDITGYTAEEDDDNVFYVDGEILRRLVGIFPDAPVAIEFSINQTSRVFVIKYTGHSFRLPIISDLEELDVPNTVNLGMIQASEFFSVINSLVKIVDTDSASQEYPSACLHLAFKDSKMAAMGTDKFAIAEISKDYTPEEDDQDYKLLIRQPQAALLSKPINPAEVLQLVYTKNMFGYVDGSGILSLVGRTEMNPLNYEPMKQAASDDCSITVDYTDFKETLETIGKLTFNTQGVILKFTADGKVKFMSASGDVMDLAISDSKGIDNGKDTQFVFTRNVLSESLIPIDTHTIRLQWEDVDSPSIFQLVPVDDDGADEDNVFIGVVPNV